MPHDQHETPYLDATLRYRSARYTPFHTPGHKLGKGAPDGLRELLGEACLQVDVAMAGGVEDTRESTHLIRLAEDFAAEAWGADRCWFLVNGSTSGIHALVLTLCGPGDEVIIPRNAHKSMLAGLIFSGAMPVYLEPEVDPLWGIPLTVSAEAAQRALAEHPGAKAVFVTSPTYNGLGSDLAAVAAAAHAAGVPFVTDQAWGPHLRFCPELPVDAMTAGADAAVVSTHKLISGITQTSVLMARAQRINLARLDSMVAMTQSTSPQVLMYASIDAARQQMATRGAEPLARTPSRTPAGRARSSTSCPACAAWAKRRCRATAWPRSTPRGSRSRAATSATAATTSRRCCATTTASPSRRPTRSTSCST